jgi:1,4-dihydroxy-2-naphthoate octaprenyltransferase
MPSALSDTLRLLRFPFSLLLLPVYLLALSQAPTPDPMRAVAVGLLLHLLVYPSSNGYNSWVDRDTTPIGGLRAPPLPPRLLWWATAWMDVLAVGLGFWVQPGFGAGLLGLVLLSRGYSWEVTRLKRLPIVGFLVVFVFQGMGVYAVTLLGSVPQGSWSELLTPRHLGLAAAASCQIGGVYPLTQVYQHREDAKRGDRTLSLLLGVRGTFVFSAVLFSLGGALFFLVLPLWQFGVYVTLLLPVLITFGRWARKAWNDPSAADFDHMMRLNVVAAVCTNLCFGALLLGRGWSP